MPMNTNVVISIVLRTCSLRLPRSPYPYAVQLSAKTPGVEGDEQHDDEDQDRDDLEDRHDPVDDRGVADPASDQVVEQPDADRGHGHGQERVAVAEAVEERAERRADEHPVEGVAGDRAGPEPDRRVEAGVVAEARLGVDEHAGVELGLADREVLEDEGEHQHAGAGDRPRDQRAEDPGRHPEPRRQREHPGADHPADHHRGQGGQAHLGRAARWTPASRLATPPPGTGIDGWRGRARGWFPRFGPFAPVRRRGSARWWGRRCRR